MVEVKFIDGTPAPNDYLTSVWQLVRDAALAVDMFGEDELEAAAREQASGDTPNANPAPKCCQVCGEDIFDEDESAFGACADCVGNVSGSECVMRTYAGFGNGEVDVVHPTLQAAIEAFDTAPIDSIPRVIRDGKTLVERDPEGGLAPIFWDGEAERVYRRVASRKAAPDPNP